MWDRLPTRDTKQIKGELPIRDTKTQLKGDRGKGFSHMLLNKTGDISNTNKTGEISRHESSTTHLTKRKNRNSLNTRGMSVSFPAIDYSV